ncbi:MAG: ATP-binding protein [Candidatus Eremiobacteraeota bacterium]|nr:ATP-binding protein [Candidatus Eremiobacteraeota bacterium]
MVKRSLAGDHVWAFDVRDGAGVSRLRREVTSFLRRHAHYVDHAASELILGELLGNVVKHTPGFAEVCVACGGGQNRLLVTDRGPGFVPTRSLPADPLDENGRGMFLVHALSRDVAIRAMPDGGTQVAVELPLKVAIPA